MVFSLKHTNAKLEWAHGFTCKVTSEGDLESSAMHLDKIEPPGWTGF